MPMWQDLFAGLALVLVIEGILPFLNPNRFRQTLALASRLTDGSLRIMGFISMLTGLLVLYGVRGL